MSRRRECYYFGCTPGRAEPGLGVSVKLQIPRDRETIAMSESSSDSEGAASDASTPRLEVTDEQKAQSEELKTKANAKFQENHFSEATDFYTKAIELNPRNHILYANRAFCHIKMENYG